MAVNSRPDPDCDEALSAVLNRRLTFAGRITSAVIWPTGTLTDDNNCRADLPSQVLDRDRLGLLLTGLLIARFGAGVDDVAVIDAEKACDPTYDVVLLRIDVSIRQGDFP